MPTPEPQPTYAGSLPPTYAPVPYSAPTPHPVAETVAAQPRQPPRRSTSYYVLLGLAALALFAISMFVTILLLQHSKGDAPWTPAGARNNTRERADR